MPARGRRILRITAACIFMGALPGILIALSRGMSPANFLEWTVYGTVYAACIAVPSALLMPRVMKRLSSRSLSQRIAGATVVLVVFSLIGCLLANLIFVAVGRLN